MIKYLHIPYQFDVAKMQAETAQLGQAYWKLHFQVKHYDGEWSALPLRSIRGEIDNGGSASSASPLFSQYFAVLSVVLPFHRRK
jgi:hypothetical protein